MEVEVVSSSEGSWQPRNLNIHDLCSSRESLTGNVLVFLSPAAASPGPAQRDLQRAFDIHPSTWTHQYQKATGFFHSREDYPLDGSFRSYSSAFRFLIKVAANDKISPYNITYSWTEVGFWTHWRPGHSSVLLCAADDLQLRQRLCKSLIESETQVCHSLPFEWHVTVLQHVSRAFDTAVWSCRDLVRDRERNRPSIPDTVSDYISMHEIARHVIHSSETLKMSLEIVSSVMDDLDAFSYQSIPASGMVDTFSSAKRTLRSAMRCEKTLLLCAHERSRALEERMQNEISLAFHIGSSGLAKTTMEDSASVKTISVLGLVFLPGTFVSAIFGMGFFGVSTNENNEHTWVVSSQVWVYWATAIPLTLLVILAWILRQVQLRQDTANKISYRTVFSAIGRSEAQIREGEKRQARASVP